MAERLHEGELREVVDAQAPLRREPSPDAALDTEALRGERVIVQEATAEGWSRGRLVTDNYVGWLPTAALHRPTAEPTHKVAVLRTLLFAGPSIKLPPVQALSLGCRLTIARIEEPFAVTTDGGHLPVRHLAPADAREADWVSVAEKFVGVPYLWGGKTSLGLDCSGLVQVALTAAGIPCPRDSHMQERELGTAVSGDLSDFRRGDLLFWKGHVAIVRDPASLIHANAFHMAVVIEPIHEALARIRAAGGELRSVRRL